MLMKNGIDTGDMLFRESLTIDDNMDVKELHDVLSQRGGALLKKTIEGIVDGSLVRVPQNEEESSHAPMITKETCEIDWNSPATQINNLIRGLSPVPAAFSYLGADRVKILKAKVLDKDYEVPGIIIEVSKGGILVATGKGALLITKLQYPGKKPMEVKDFLNGHEINEKSFGRSVD
jgi:methionyl-tRNA formyltransferase